MPTTRIASGVNREIWRGTDPIDGGASLDVPTGIRASQVVLAHVFGLLRLDTIVGSPSITATPSVVDHHLVVTITNAAAPGNSTTWTLDVFLMHSMQQGLDRTALGGIYVITPATAAAPGAGALLDWGTDEGRATTIGAQDEEVLWERVVDLSTQAPGTIIQVSLAGIVLVSDDETVGTFKIYLGSTTPRDTAGGTVRATITTSSESEVIVSNTGAAFANPGGKVLLQVTGQNSDGANDYAAIRGIGVRIQ